MDSTTKILALIAAASILYYYYKKWVAYNEALQKQTWPLVYPSCPDYWEVTSDKKCKNTFNLGSCPKDSGGNQPDQGIKDFNTQLTMKLSESQTKKERDDALRQRCIYAKDCGISWEGIDTLCA